MSRLKIKSIFEQISVEVFKPNLDLIETKKKVIEFVESKDINEKDKLTIIKNINEVKTVIKLQTYICNSLLQYEGLGMNQISKISKDDIN